MQTKRQWLNTLLCTGLVLSNSLAVFAQGQDRVQFTVPDAGVVIASGAAPQVQFIQNEFHFDSAVVKGAPYSAEAVTETVQTLGDGNRIVRTSTAKTYRDSAGRTRREQVLNVVGAWAVSGDAPKTIFISDPVAGVQYNLDPRSKTATKISVQRLSNLSGDKVTVARATGAAATTTVNGERRGDQVRFVTDDNRSVVLATEGSSRAEVEARASRGAAAGAVTGFTTAGGQVLSFASEAEVNREALGTQTIEGVQAEGTRVSFTIPAGRIGNERPIVTVSERWYSPELQAVVLSKASDPRSGETTYRLTNLNRSEPDATLFQLPSDYTVKEGGFSFGSGAADVIRRMDTERRARRPNDN